MPPTWLPLRRRRHPIRRHPAPEGGVPVDDHRFGRARTAQHCLVRPAYRRLDWLLCHALARIADPGQGRRLGNDRGRVPHFRLTTRPSTRLPSTRARRRLGDATLRRQVLAGAYRLRDAGTLDGAPVVQLAACGAGVARNSPPQPNCRRGGARPCCRHHLRRPVVCRVAPCAGASARRRPCPGVARRTFGHAPRSSPCMTPRRTLAWLGSALGNRACCLGVDALRPVRHRRRPSWDPRSHFGLDRPPPWRRWPLR